MTNLAVSLAVHVVVLVGLRVQGIVVASGLVPVPVSRKTSHILLGAIVLSSWLAYEDSASARWLAALPLLVVALYFAGLGVGAIRDERTVRGASRSGRPREMLYGPMLYCASVVPLTILFWRSPVSVASFAFLIFGDGLGEVVGARVRSPALPWNRRKSTAGTLAVLLGGWVGCMVAFGVFEAAGFLALPPGEAWRALVLVCGAGALAESATPGAWDNVTVVWSCALAGMMLF